MIEISQQTFAALSKDAEERGVTVCQECPQKKDAKGRKILYLGPNGEREIFYQEE